jgi:hypothetical protein
VASENRNVRAVQEAGVLERASFFDRRLEDHSSSRIVFFCELWQIFTKPALLFTSRSVHLNPDKLEHLRQGP